MIDPTDPTDQAAPRFKPSRIELRLVMIEHDEHGNVCGEIDRPLAPVYAARFGPSEHQAAADLAAQLEAERAVMDQVAARQATQSIPPEILAAYQAEQGEQAAVDAALDDSFAPGAADPDPELADG